MRLNLTIDPDLDRASPVTHISERGISMAESEWAKRMAQEFKAGKARKAEEDAKLLEEQRIRKESASKLWTDVRSRLYVLVWNGILSASFCTPNSSSGNPEWSVAFTGLSPYRFPPFVQDERCEA
jgi:hypothetical protein